jgi:hypothetical protein
MAKRSSNDTLICDFCSSSDVHWAYESIPFQTRIVDPILNQPLDYSDDGKWVVCAICTEMIEREDHNALVEYSLIKYEQDFPAETVRRHYSAFRQFVTTVHTGFWLNKGPRLSLAEALLRWVDGKAS